MGTPVPCGLAGVVTPMGCVSLSWLRETADPDATPTRMLRARAAGFFPWWEAGRARARARRRRARRRCGEFPWHPPQGDETETALANVALACLGPTPSSLGPGGAHLTPRHRGAGDHDAVTHAARARGRLSADGFGFMRRNREDGMPFPGLHARAARATSTSRTTTTDHAKVYWFGDRVVSRRLVAGQRADEPKARPRRASSSSAARRRSRGDPRRRARSPSKRRP